MEVKRTGTEPLTEQELIEKWNVDTDRREPEKLETSTRQSQQKGPDGEPNIIDLYRTFMRWKLKHPLLNYEEMIKRVFNEFNPVHKVPKLDIDGDRLGVVIHSDIHFDRIENKQTKRYLNDIEDRTLELYAMMEKLGMDTMLYANLGDMANSDGNRRTTNGTEQINSMPESERFGIALESQVQLYRNLKQFKLPIKGIYVRGNHDELFMQSLADALELFMRREELITIDNEDKFRKYHGFGKSNLMFDHGDKLKEKDLMSVLSMESKLREFNYAIRGHIHQQTKQLFGNLWLQTVGSTSNPSRREQSKGYIAKSLINGLIIDKKKGKIIDLYN